LSELADYCKVNGHCNVPQYYSENSKLGYWVAHQRTHYRFHLEGKTSQITLSRIQALESLGFEWKASINHRKGTPKKPSLNDDAIRVSERASVAPEHTQQLSLKKISAIKKSAAIKSTSLSNPKIPIGMAKSTSTSSRVEPQTIKRMEGGEARFDETDPPGLPSKLAARPRLYSERQATKSLTPDKSAPSDDGVEPTTRKDALQAKLSWPAHQQISVKSLSHPALSKVGSAEIIFVVPAKMPVNSRQAT
jgi:hypothetical protein